MSKYGNENAAAGGRSKDTAGRDAQYGGGGGFGGGHGGGFGGKTPSKAGNPTVADHMIATGRISAPSIPSGGVARGNYPTQDDAYNDYSKAVGSYATRGWLDKALDFLGGGFYDPQEPMAGNPRSYAGGDFHSTSNPGSILGGLAGMFAGPLGPVVGPAAGAAYTAAGLPEIWHGGYEQPDIRTGLMGNSTAPMGGSMADIGSGHTFSSGGPSMANGPASPQGGGTGQGGLLSNGFNPQTAQRTHTVTPPGITSKPAPGNLYSTMAARYQPINAQGLMNYGVWSPQHTYAA